MGSYNWRKTSIEILLISILVILVSLTSIAAEDSSYTIEIYGVAFDHSDISVWYNDTGIKELDEAVDNALQTWNKAITEFAQEYGYHYLGNLDFEETSSYTFADVIINYVNQINDACGRTEVSYTSAGRIVHVDVKLSKDCIGTDYVLAYTVASHELGHALGLGHSNTEDDLMYPYYRGVRTPSTLDLYALSVIYDWMKDGVFQKPTAENLQLPETIEFKYLPSQEESSGTVTIRFLIDTGLGITVHEVRNVPYGTIVTFNADDVIDPGNKTRFIFIGWYSGGRLISRESTIQINATQNMDYVATYVTEYQVSIDLGYQNIRKWISRGDDLNIAVKTVRDLNNKTRLIFNGWEGDLEGENSTVNVKVYKPIESKALWKPQYYVEVVSEFANITGSGWYDNGSKVKIESPESEIYLGETKAILTGFLVNYYSEKYDDYFENKTSIEITVCSPITVTAKWNIFHHVIILSSYVNPTIFDGWIKDGELLEKSIEKEVLYENSTKIVFKKWSGDIISENPHLKLVVNKPMKILAEWTIYYLVKVMSDYDVKGGPIGWVERGEEVFFNASPTVRILDKNIRIVFSGWGGSIVSDNPVIDVKNLTSPLILKTIWKKQYLVVAEAPEVINFSYRKWVDSGGSVEINAPKEVKISDKKKLVFEEWIGCTSHEPLCTIQEVSHPISLEAKYSVEWFLKVIARSYDGDILENVSIKLKKNDEVINASSGEFIWIGEGEWIVDESLWNMFDVTSHEKIYVDRRVGESGILYVPVRVFKASFRVSDLIGFPIKDAKIVVRTLDGTILFEGKTDEHGEVWNVGPLPSSGLIVEASFLGFHSQKSFDISMARPIQLTLPLSLTSIYGFIGILAVVTVLTVLFSVRGKGKPGEVEHLYEYPPHVPPYPPPTRSTREEIPRSSETVVPIEEVLKELEEEEELKKTLEEKLKKEKEGGE